MFAVLKTGGKQYRVQSGDVLRVEKLDAEAGETIQFNEVLIVGDQIGAPFVAGAAVQATVIDQIKGEKTIHFVRRRRKHSSKRTKGHRQQLTLLRVTDILAGGAEGTGVKAAIGTGTGQGAAPVSLMVRVRQAASTVRQEAGEVLDRVENAAERVVDVVEDAVESRTGKVALAAVAAAGVAAIAAAAFLPGSSDKADDSADNA
ncbi:50S ribosomal protein L21 [Rubellimicrobium rubrum]|uniref:Large ribosomal subunit protein bL21 n=1 Tax=Rubellimicrobium rubrum TaxID=2585369 RepID=A0A5C4N2R5_9RHOB|nr:50S ribosomal protein L21 [Rubellimicrobium rubrum]TNC51221.1 50S ribosomal protein L21 [Rubellimicrobium rubrum]